MKRILLIDEKVKARAAEILAYAEDHRYDPSDKSEGWENRIPGRNVNLQCMIYDGYRCVFSYTLSPSKSKYYRHLSISINNRFNGAPYPSVKQDYPAPTAVMVIAGLFGFTGEPTGDSPIPKNWMVEMRPSGHPTDDPCIVIAQEREVDG